MNIKIYMEEGPYSNRQVERLLDQQSTELKQEMKSLTEPILAQTTKTNGRVTAVEKVTQNLVGWMKFTRGGLAILSIIVVPVLGGYLLWLGKLVIELKTQQVIQTATIQTAVDAAFSKNLEVTK